MFVKVHDAKNNEVRETMNKSSHVCARTRGSRRAEQSASRLWTPASRWAGRVLWAPSVLCLWTPPRCTSSQIS